MNAAIAAGAQDWRTLELGAGGRSLIQASAGTGKTWTIAVLYLRLLLERSLSPPEIVVTTFTEAAAQELARRLRAKLEWALGVAAATAAASAASAVAVDPPVDAAWLRARWLADPAQRGRDVDRLEQALAAFDLAPIKTLHGLCRRVLEDHPFACGVPFVPGDLVASAALLDEVTRDVWRRLQQGDAADALVALARDVAPDLTLARLAAGLATCLKPGVTLEVPDPPAAGDLLSSAWAGRLRALAARPVFYQGSVLRRTWAALADFIDARGTMPDPEWCGVLAQAEQLKGVLKAGKADPEVLAAAAYSVEVAQALGAQCERAQRELWRELGTLARTEMAARLDARRQLTFDGLLEQVAAALAPGAPAARALADALHAAWPVALVDEFQDTDGLQYGILDAIYRDGAGACRGRLVLIGDPKQAIYRFRGGDIHTYRRAADQVPAADRLALATNFRSSPAFVAACNEWYACAGSALGAEREAPIRYVPVAASDRCADRPYAEGGAPCTQPLVVHYLGAAPRTAAARRTLALRVCANRIAGLLASGRHTIGGAPVVPADLAVLLPTARAIAELRDLLVLRGVPCVTSTRTSVFHTDTARELQLVLYAVLHDDDVPALRGAAATRLWGDGFRDLRARDADAAGWQPVVDAFRAWRAAWRARGVLAVLAEIRRHLAARYLATAEGERVLTDLGHLGELLQAQDERVAGEEELLAWLARCREDAAAGGMEVADAAELRIESDAARVQLMTLHASKGLEFPIVFLPLLWDHGEGRRDDPVLVDGDAGQRTLGFSAQARERAAQDLQDERFRVSYVALTRAIHACHVFALPPDRPASARTEKPTQGTARSALDVMLARIEPPLLEGGSLSAELRARTPHIAWVAGWEPAALRVYRDAAAPAGVRQARPLPPAAEGPLPARHSFTTLVAGVRQAAFEPGAAADEADAETLPAALPEADLVAPEEAAAGPADAELLALAAVRGTDIGNAIHAVFEHRGIGVPLARQRDLVRHCLDAAGVYRHGVPRAALVDALARRLDAALAAPLGLAADPAFGLAQLAAVDLRAEMEFCFTLDGVALDALRAACARHGEGGLVPASTRVISGLMTGKLDLLFRHGGVFHVLDYKGNYLGDRVADYTGAALLRHMDQAHYRFQALIYTVAADRYLAQRRGAAYRRERELGACVYLFVRAAGLAPDAGIWRHRFSDALLDAVGMVLGAPATTLEEI